jgi:hypothetical protein
MRWLLELALSANTVVVMWLAGGKHLAAWVVALVGQVGWLAFVVWSGSWGLLPLVLFLVVVYARNFALWRADAWSSEAAS